MPNTFDNERDNRRDSLRDEIRATAENVRALTVSVGAIAESLRELDRKSDSLARQVFENTIKLRDGMSGGAEKEFESVHKDASKLREDLNSVTMKTSRWEAGGSVLYIIVTMAGGLIGWLVSHFSFTGK